MLTHHYSLSPAVSQEYGGKGFSTAAVSAILAKLATHCVDANATVAVPNSLGPGELLVRYGTDDQKGYFLPRLADGTLIPCFGLTGVHSGSDATSLIGSFGTVEKRDGKLGVRTTFKKRYITLAPVAGVVGIGFDLKDPDNLLADIPNATEGFTVALLERSHPGLNMGPRHVPLVAAFMNGTVEGTDVWVPMENILGGVERCGFGWHMFVECLAEGRGVSLPAASIASARSVAGVVGAYCRARKQFKVPIAEFGGIQEALADAASDGLAVIAGGDLMNAIVDNHEAPMVVSSIMKQNCTNRGRDIVKHGMDITAGSGISRGPRNYMSSGYLSLPVAITVEGANVMTRSFQIIGQGLTRCHPHMLELIESLQSDDPGAQKVFGTQLKKVIGHGFTNVFDSITRGIRSSVESRARADDAYTDGYKMVRYHEDQLLRLSANFAITADLCFTLGGKLKFEELLMGRLADCMGAIFLGYATLHHYEMRKGVKGLEAVTEHAMLRLEVEAQEALREARRNFPGPLGGFAGTVMGACCFPLGSFSANYRLPSDSLTKIVANQFTKPTELWKMYLEGVYINDPKDGKHQLSDLVRSMPELYEADKVAKEIRAEGREATELEKKLLDRAVELRDDLVQVDVFDKVGFLERTEGYVRPALLGTEEMLKENEFKTFDEYLGKRN